LPYDDNVKLEILGNILKWDDLIEYFLDKDMQKLDYETWKIFFWKSYFFNKYIADYFMNLMYWNLSKNNTI
jgi:hypothetical protein